MLMLDAPDLGLGIRGERTGLKWWLVVVFQGEKRKQSMDDGDEVDGSEDVMLWSKPGFRLGLLRDVDRGKKHSAAINMATRSVQCMFSAFPYFASRRGSGTTDFPAGLLPNIMTDRVKF